MNRNARSIAADRKPQASRCGSALLLVLACIVLVTGVIVAFVVSMREQVVTSKSSADADGVRRLGETAVNIAIAQVQDATKLSGSSGWSWASQPGMIRLFDTSGAGAGFYKLYSWDNMVGSGAFNPFAAQETIPSSGTGAWSSNPALYTDLNAPVLSGGRQYYPILDPATIDANSAEGALSGTLAVDQFTLSATTPLATGTAPNAAPMPVKWLYLLADGTVQVPTSGSGSMAVVAAATAANPIVGRIAFWTDDETCKININTASVGMASPATTSPTNASPWTAASYNTFWDVPRFCTQLETAFAMAPPAVREYQRYPGHPATVALNAVFPVSTLTDIASLFGVTPRYASGGSVGGTQTVRDPIVGINISNLNKRLYATSNEILFDPNRAANANLTPDLVARSDFFITTSGRSPELNLFGLPRISIWPENNSTSLQTVSDQLLAFCSTVGGHPFYFTRADPLSKTNDINLPRNLQLLNYLDALTNLPIPGFGGNFNSKLGADKRQVLTEIFDYIRNTNLNDSTSGTTYRFAPTVNATTISQVSPSFHTSWGTQGFGGHVAMPNEVLLQFVGLGSGKSSVSGAAAVPVNPTQIGSRIGMNTGVDPSGNTPPDDQMAVQAYLLVNFLIPGQSFAEHVPRFWLEISGLDQFGITMANGSIQPLGFPADGAKIVNVNWPGTPGVTGWVGQLDFRCLTSFNTIILDRPAANTANQTSFPFYSNILAVPTAAPMNFQGGTITLKIYALTAANGQGDLIQTVEVPFPSAQFPVPKLATCRNIGIPGSQPAAITGDRWDYWNLDMPSVLIDPANDTVRSVLLAAGDTRLLARSYIPASDGLYQPHPSYMQNNVLQAYSTRAPVMDSETAGGTWNFQNATYGRLVSNGSFNPDISLGMAPFTTGSAPGIGGDWDNGIAEYPDGPYINQPDEGTLIDVTNYAAASTVPYFNGPSYQALGSAYFSPNRMVSSPGTFGSLPTGVLRKIPWQTLLFRPVPPGYAGATSPKDYLLMDLFWMPIVEPYAISDPFSSAGKVNLNQQMVPFTYINRMTGLRAALASEMVAAMPLSMASTYKIQDIGNGANLPNFNSRLPINLSATDGTLRQINERFAAGDIFRSPSEICDIYLVPAGYSWSSDSAAQAAWYGNNFALVGDNTREKPYANLYGKLTTKSNSYTVHYQVQLLRKSTARNASDPTTFDSSKGDQIAAEERGSSTFERYIDPADARLTSGDPATNSSSLEGFYRVRIVNSKTFNP